MTVNPEVSFLDLILEAGIPGDVMWSFMDDKNSVLHHDGFLVDMVYNCLDSTHTIMRPLTHHHHK